VSEEDRKNIYSSIHTSPTTPSELYNKVQWDIRLYCIHRGEYRVDSSVLTLYISPSAFLALR
jgi:hypothetical protein